MKRQYVKPSVFCVKLDSKRTFLQGSYEVSDDTISKENEDLDAGWAREENINESNNRNTVWDNIW